MNKRKNVFIAIAAIILMFAVSAFLIYSSESTTKTVELDENTLTILLVQDTSAYCYRGKEPEDGKFVSKAKMNDLIVEKKNAIGVANMKVLIKQTRGATQPDVKDVLNALARNGITKVTVEDNTNADVLIRRK